MRKIIALLVLALGSPSCLGGGAGGGISTAGPGEPYGDLSIDQADSTVSSPSAHLSGSLYRLADPPGNQVVVMNTTTGGAGVGGDFLIDETYWFLGYTWTERVHKWQGSVPLVPGPNVVTVTATDTLGHTATASTTVTYDPGPLAVHLLSPTTGAAWATSESTLTLSGSVTGPQAPLGVAWTNLLTGATGTATGTSSWTAVVPLAPGVNPIRVDASDGSGLVASGSLEVTYTPVLTIRVTSPTTTGSWSTSGDHVRVAWEVTNAAGSFMVSVQCGESGFGQSVSGAVEVWDVDVPLAPGKNLVELLVLDAAGARATATQEVTSTR